jgi:hypothetical protein
MGKKGASSLETVTRLPEKSLIRKVGRPPKHAKMPLMPAPPKDSESSEGKLE